MATCATVDRRRAANIDMDKVINKFVGMKCQRFDVSELQAYSMVILSVKSNTAFSLLESINQLYMYMNTIYRKMYCHFNAVC